jgi:MYXO-CTERM domain-containing protein
MNLISHRTSKKAVLSLACAGALTALCWTTPAQAIVLSGNVTSGPGTFMKLTAPLANPFGPANSVGDNTFQDPNLYAFDEGQNILIPGPLAVDDLFGPQGAGNIAGGTVVASHYVFFDPGPSTSVVGNVEFDSDILGVISSTGNLGASDFLINNGVNYLNPGLRGLEGGDTVTIDDSRHITVRWTASDPGDYIRVLTAFSPGGAATPEPVTAALGLMSLGALGLGVRRRSI